jgi:hypothetical protein
MKNINRDAIIILIVLFVCFQGNSSKTNHATPGEWHDKWTQLT